MKPFPCDGIDCGCSAHIDTETHVPTCPIHSIPLVSAALGYGKCPVVAKTVTGIGGQAFQQKECITWPAEKWVWRHRDNFADSDIPPWDGWQPVDLSFLTPDGAA